MSMSLSRKSRRVAGVSALVLGIGAVTWTAGVAGGNFAKMAPPSAPTIAVVDLEAAFNGLTERTDLENQLKQTRTEMQTKLDELQKQAGEKRGEIEPLPAGPQKIAKAKEFSEFLIRTEVEGQIAQKKLDAMRAELRRELYLKIVDAVQRVSKQNNYALVLASDEKVQIPLGDPEDVARAISFKRMLHVDPTLNITSDIITIMNNEYAATKR